VASKLVVTPDDPHWSLFHTLLSEKSKCHGNTDNARAILAIMPDIDVEASLAALAELGGTCDCTITFDVAATEQRRA
jgi:hypothetical protein